MKILNGKELAGFVKERQSHMVKTLKEAHIQPTLLIIYDNDNPVIQKYIQLKNRYGEDIGVKVEIHRAESSDDIATTIEEANKNPNIHGIILQLPIKDQQKTDELTSKIAAEKDVDGLSNNANAFDSATATAINWLLTGYNIPLEKSKIAIIGRGKLVGAPLFKMYQASNYNVTQFHKGDDLSSLTNYDVIITATGVPNLITNEMIRPGTTIVDAGTASEKGVIKGDVSDEVRTRTDLTAITPIIGGVGPLTISCLFDHVIQSASKSQKK
ncbi:bifunctional 5,10-methylenetetrahydrofolate dehydrogenase/5,10-methenyltetrahydrofolate cyclohydrolase [Candidatus Saccharibacteria bacterium]|nr:bifunctional 5,10-methylenetetrahydrofolate dehydrogenase/5,10-methenyltetrahydrofolate cyclohydrolase [Candidatus Saccharibacteria bacterium]